MWLILKKKCAFVERIKDISVLFELCISLQTKNRTSASVWIFLFFLVKQKNVTVCVQVLQNKWMHMWRGGWKLGRQTNRILLWHIDIETQIQRLSSSKICRAYSWCFSSYADWKPCYLSSNKSNIDRARKPCGSWNKRYVCGKTKSSKPILEQF